MMGNDSKGETLTALTSVKSRHGHSWHFIIRLHFNPLELELEECWSSEIKPDSINSCVGKQTHETSIIHTWRHIWVLHIPCTLLHMSNSRIINHPAIYTSFFLTTSPTPSPHPCYCCRGGGFSPSQLSHGERQRTVWTGCQPVRVIKYNWWKDKQISSRACSIVQIWNAMQTKFSKIKFTPPSNVII